MSEDEKRKVVLVCKKDLIIEWFSGHGAGGQYRNRHLNCCRITHKESGGTGIGTKQRSAQQNQKDAFSALCSSVEMKLWLSQKLMELCTGKTIEERVEEQMQPQFLKVEGLENGQWVPLNEDSNSSE